MRVDATSYVVLDAGVLGLVTNPSAAPEPEACKNWLRRLLLNGVTVAVPEIADYEVRRELIRADKLRGLRTLDVLRSQLLFIPITSAMMLKAAETWAQLRKQGQPTAAPGSLDGDVILAAQALIAAEANALDPVVATDNVGHLSRMITAAEWRNIQV